MAGKKKQPKKEEVAAKPPPVATGVKLPAKKLKRHAQEGVGVTGSRRSVNTGPRKRNVHGFTAAGASTLFPKGGEAFARWAQAEKGIEPHVRMTEAEWAPLIEEFANRPIYGHRRGPSGGSHRINDQHRR